MSRRSERLRLRYQALVDGQSSSSSSRGSSQVAGQHTNFTEGPLRTVRRKSSMVRSLSPGLSPAPHLLTGVTGWESPGSTSGYFSEDDGAAFQWRLKTTWHCVTTAASLQDFFLSIRKFCTRKKGLVFVLGLLLLMASLAYGAWYFYPYGLQTLPPAVLSWWAAKGSGRTEDRWESGQSPSYFQELESGVVHKTSEWHSSSQEGFVETRPKRMGSLEAQLVGLRQELVALSQSQAEVEKESHLGPEKMVALRNEVESKVPGWIQQVLHLKLGDVQAQLRDLEHRLLRYMTEEQDKCAGKVAAILRLSLVKEGVTSGVTKEKVHQIVEQALKKYSADRIGLVDYALESSGASIVSRRSSPTYGMRTEWSGHFTLFGIPLWRYFQSPRLILQPDVYPGNCWAFRGHQGFVVVRLSARIQLTAITLEHVPKALSPTADIPSAPKDFVILGLNEDSQADGVALGQFTYDNAGEAIQTFHLEGNDTAPYQLVELRILSNWGHPDYTCIYRFRVHGKPAT